MSTGEAEHFSLRWNNFHSNLATGFHALLEEVDLVDVTIAAEGQFVQAHKIVLSVSSPYFKELFKVNPCKHPIVILKDVCHKELVAILQFMYQGEVNVRQEELGAFLKTAEMLQIKGLTGNEPSPDEAPPPPRMRMKADPPVNSEEGTPRVYKRQRTDMPVQSAMRTTPSTSSRVMSPAPHPPPPPVTTQPPATVQPSAPVQASVPAPAPTPNSVTIPKTAPLSPATVAEESVPFDMPDEQRPKEEPADYESDIEEIECKVVQTSSSLNQLLHGESSMLSQGSPQNSSNLFASLTGISQDSGSSQDGAQGLKWKYVGFDNNNISCPYCHRQFGYRGNLTIHIRDVHSAQGPHICPQCGKKMKNKSSLRTHLYRQHNKDLTDSSDFTKE